MFVKLFGRVMDCSFSQQLKAKSPIVVVLFEREIDVRDEQFEKVPLSMVVTPFGTTIEARLLQP